MTKVCIHVECARTPMCLRHRRECQQTTEYHKRTASKHHMKSNVYTITKELNSNDRVNKTRTMKNYISKYLIKTSIEKCATIRCEQRNHFFCIAFICLATQQMDRHKRGCFVCFALDRLHSFYSVFVFKFI